MNFHQEDANDSLLDDLRKSFDELDKTLIESAVSVPGVKTIFKLLYPYTTLGRIMTRLAGNVRNTIACRRQHKMSRQGDMLQLMLDAQGDYKKGLVDFPRNGCPWEDDLLTSNSIIMVMAGFGTTASTLTFILYLLAAHPEEQKKVYDEMRRHVANGKNVDFDELQKLRRLDMVVRETMRLFPAIPIMISRVCYQDINVMGQRIPAGVNIIIPAWHLHRDPQLWSQPSTFYPERFLEDRPERNPVTFIPFGIGERACIGKRLALFEIKAALFKVLTNYELVLGENTKFPCEVVVPSVISKPKNPIMLRLRSRQTVYA